MASDNSKEVNAVVESFKDGLRQALALAQDLASTNKPLSILVAISGGIDSTALLLLLNSLKDDLQLSLLACHVNHHVRGEEADKDEEFCRNLCHQLTIPFSVEHLDPPADPTSISEEQLRQSRYEKLTAVAQAKGVGIVATAHTRDDQVETLLFRLFRGSGKPGLVGMPQARKLADDIALIRPMLHMSHGDCQAYLNACNQEARMDSSNNNLAYRRNFIRHRVIPVIKEQFCSLTESLERFRNLNQEEEAFIASAVDTAIVELSASDLHHWPRNVFLGLAPAIQRRVLWQGLKLRDIEPSFERIESCRRAIEDKSAVSLNETWDLRASNNSILWQDKSQIGEPVEPWQVELKIPGVTPILALNYALKIEELHEAVSSYPLSNELRAVANLGHATLPLVVRSRMAGDTIQPFGMQETVKLKKYLHNRKPETGNPFTNVVVADQNEVIWVPGVGLSNKVRVEDKPSHLLTWLKLAADCAIC